MLAEKGFTLIIDGKAIAKRIDDRIGQAIASIEQRPPSLAFILVGNDPASQTYIRMKKKKCEEVGIRSVDIILNESVPQSELLGHIETLNQDLSIDGILVQLPLPPHLSEHAVLTCIEPSKDVDGFHPVNMGKLLLGEKDGFIPCTPYGISVLLQEAQIDIEGKHLVIVGRSNIVGKPLAALLMQKQKGANATVTIAHSKTENLSSITRSADILIAAIGKPHFITEDMVAKNTVVVDVGINRMGGKLVGDVDFDNVIGICKAITPVPGGVGPMTIAMLLSNTLLSYQRRVR